MAKKSMILKQQAEPKFSSRRYNRCKICGRPHAYLRDYGVCRICFRELAYKGQITEANTANAVIAQVSMGSAADLAAVVAAAGELGLSLLLQDHRLLSHLRILLIKR